MLKDSLLTRGQAARELGVHRHTLRAWDREHAGPPTLRFGKRYYYHREVLAQWLKARMLA